MTYYISIGNNKKMIRFVIIYSLCLIFILTLPMAFIDYEVLASRTNSMVLLVILIVGIPPSIVLGIRRHYGREHVSILEDGIKTKRFGLISFSEMSNYHVHRTGGFDSIHVLIDNKNELVLSPSSNFKPEAFDVFSSFSYELKSGYDASRINS